MKQSTNSQIDNILQILSSEGVFVEYCTKRKIIGIGIVIDIKVVGDISITIQKRVEAEVNPINVLWR